MSRYKEMMQSADIMQKDLLTEVQRVDGRVDKSLLSKIVNGICLPTPMQLDAICAAVECGVFDIYDLAEIDLTKQAGAAVNAVATPKQSRGGLSHGENIYNLTVEIDREVAARVFSKDAMRKLGIHDRSDYIRQCVDRLAKRLDAIEAKEKAAQDANASTSGSGS